MDDALSGIPLSCRELFESIPLGIVFQDSSGSITAANPAAEQILGLTIEQMRGRHSVDPLWQSIHEDGSPFPGETHPTMVALKTGRAVTDAVMGVFNPSTAKQTWISICATPIFDAGQKSVKAAYSVFKDITCQKTAERALKKANQRLENLAGKLRWLSQTDPLTGLANRLAFNRSMRLEFLRFQRFRLPVALMMIDVDHFKQVNDRCGHAVGDQALAALAAVLLHSVRSTDLAARYGGEEFTLAITGSDCDLALRFAQQILAKVRNLRLDMPTGPLQLRVSIGLSCFHPEDTDWMQALSRADQALYRAKAKGRDRVFVFPSSSPSVSLTHPCPTNDRTSCSRSGDAASRPPSSPRP